MKRLTRYDAVRGCYVIDPDATGNHIQKLGQLEDRDEAKGIMICIDADEREVECGVCGRKEERVYKFCPACGQRLKWGD